MKRKHLPPEKVFLLIGNDHWNDEGRFIVDGTVVVPVSMYAQHCSNSSPVIYRVSDSMSALKKYKRAHDFKQKINQGEK